MVESTPEDVHLAWDTPASDGGHPVKSYLVEKKRTERKVWQVATETSESEHTVENLIEDAKYDFRVTAKTEDGDSEPAELLNVVARFSYGNERTRNTAIKQSITQRNHEDRMFRNDGVEPILDHSHD